MKTMHHIHIYIYICVCLANVYIYIYIYIWLMCIYMYIHIYLSHASSMHQGRSSVMHCFPCRFWVPHHIGSNSNSGMTLEESSCLQDSDMLRTVTLLKQSKKPVRPDFDRSLLTYVIQHQIMKTGHFALLCMVNVYIYIYIYIYIKLATFVAGDLKALFSIATTLRCREGRYSIPWIAPLYP